MYAWRVLCNTLTASPLLPTRVRSMLLNRLGLDIHPTASVGPRCTFKGRNVTLGPHTFLNQEVFVGDGPLHIGERCAIGPRAMFLTTTHPIHPIEQRYAMPVTRPITVEDCVWIGANAIILPGVTIASGCVIAAGAVVTRDTLQSHVYAGVPASPIRAI